QQKKFKARTPLSDEVYNEEKNLSRQKADQQKTESARREQEKKKQTEQAAQEVTRKKPQWLADWKKQLVNDLNRAHYNAAITDVTGVQYTGIVRATPDNLVMKVPYGELGLPWARLSPKTLLTVSSSF